MNRELTKREKTLLLVLVVLVLVLGYCKLFLEPIDRQITSLRTNTDIEQAELDTDRVRLAQLEQMQQAIAAIKASGQERALPQYDNDQALMTELDKLMAATLQYEVDCTEGTTQEAYLVLRPVDADLPDRFLRPVPPDHRRAERQRQCQLPLQRGRAV